MKISEIAPPGREKQVKKLKKKFDDPGAPYAIAWAQHNKHGKPKKNEGKMSDIDIDLKTLSDADFEKKYSKSKAQMQKDLAEQDVPTQKGRDAKPDVLTPRAMNVVKKQIKKDANKQRRADSKKAVDVEEAPFGKAVKSALGRVASRTATAVKKKVGAVPGLGNLKTTAQAQQSVNDVSDQVWNSYLKFKATNPDEEQKISWFKKNHQMDVKATIDQNGDITRDEVEAGVKSALAQQQSGKASKPTTDTQDKKDVQVKLDLLKKSDPSANVTTLVALKKFAQDGKLDPTRQQALQPLVAKIANALNNPGKANILARALQESLSQSDLSKLDMLAREGLVNKNKVSRFKTAMRMLAKDKDLPISYKDDVIEVVSKLAKIITKPSVMGMVRKGLKENQTTTTAQEQFKTWVNQADDIIS